MILILSISDKNDGIFYDLDFFSSNLYFFIQSETKRIIVEFGARRQQFILTDRLISTSKLVRLIGNRFDIQLENNSPYTLQMYDMISNEYHSLDDYKRIFNLMKDFEELHRFRIIPKSLQLQVDDYQGL